MATKLLFFLLHAKAKQNCYYTKENFFFFSLKFKGHLFVLYLHASFAYIGQ